MIVPSPSRPVNPFDDKAVKRTLREKDLKIATAEMTLSALQSQMSDLNLRARQAEDMVNLMSTDWDMKQVAEVIARHFDQRGHERSVQQQALIQATLVSLNTALINFGQDEEVETLKTTVNTVVKGLTQALGTMHEMNSKQNQVTQNLTRSANGTPSRD